MKTYVVDVSKYTYFSVTNLTIIGIIEPAKYPMIERNDPQPGTEQTSFYPTEVASVWESDAREAAAQYALQGYAIGTYNRGVCAIWGDGANPTFPDTVAHIKGELRGERPLAASLRTHDFVQMVNALKN